MNNLVIPVVMWGSRAPTHKICCIAMSRNRSHIITGCMDGQLVIWEVNDDQTSVLPKTMLFGHSGSIVSIAPVPCQSSDGKTYFITASSNNELCLWNLADGCCLEQTKLAGSVTQLMAFEMETNGRLETFVLCYGFFAEILLLSATNLDVLCTLVSRIYPDWMSSCCLVRSTAVTSVIGLTVSGTIKVWHLTDISRGRSSSLLEDESKQLRCQNAIGLRHLAVPVNLLLVLLPLEWQLYDGGDFSLLYRTSNPSESQLSGGDFFANGSVAVWDKEGAFYMYHLSFSHTDQEKYREDVRMHSSTKPKLLYSFDNKKAGELILPVIQLIHSHHSEVKSLLISGDTGGKVCLQTIEGIVESNCKISIVLQFSTSLIQHWEGLGRKPAGVIDKVAKPEASILITTSLYLEGIGQLACGCENGSIVLVQAAKACMAHLLQSEQLSKRSTIPHLTLRGHQDRITCMLYPHQESARYPANLFVSGGGDFSVILWEIFTGVQVHVFNVHGGEITQLLVPPENCSLRIQQSICSVSSDNSVALLSVKERKCVMFASRHTSRVRSIKWRAADDFMMVYCFDGALFVWQMETGHLDRFVTGLMAAEALEACTECPNEKSDGVIQGMVNLSQAFKRHNLAGFKAVAQQGIKSILETFEDKLQQTELEQSHMSMVTCGKALLVQPLRACPTQDYDSHVLFFNTETIIGTLLQEALQKKVTQKYTSTKNGKELNSAKKVINAVISQMKNQLLDSSDQNLPVLASSFPERKSKEKKKNRKPKYMEIASIMNIGRLLLSCLHGWGLDEKLDAICRLQLGLCEPVVPICFGLLSREGQTALMLPTQVNTSESCLAAVENSIAKYSGPLRHSGHWGISSLLTTRHLITVISLANTMMELTGLGMRRPEASAEVRDEENGTSTSSPSESYTSNSIEIAGVKQGWSVLATMYCVLLPELLVPFSYKPPEIELLARRWQDRCLEVREAAQALLLAKLRQLEPDERRKIVRDWAQYMPDYIKQQHLDLIPNSRTEENFGESSSGARLDDVTAVAGPNSQELGNEIMLTQPVAQKSSYESRRRQATAVVILGVIGAEFGHEMSTAPSKSGYNASEQDVFYTTDYSLARNTCKALVYLLLQPASPRLPAHAPIRRAAIDLLGRGFTVWEPYIEVSAVLLGLLELCVDYDAHIASIQSGLPLSPKADSCRSSHHALCLIASVRPLTFITTIAREVTRHNAAAANPQHQALLSTSIIVRSKAEILRIAELLADKMLRNVMELLIEFMDIVLFCIDTTALCSSQSLAEAVPALSRFSMISYDPHTKRIAVGTRQGIIHLYDLRSNKHQEVSRGSCAISVLSFSPEGKYLAAYSLQDNHLSFWITSSSLFGMLQPQVKCVKTLRPLPTAVFQSLVTCSVDSTKFSLKLRWINNRSTALLLSDGTEYRCHV